MWLNGLFRRRSPKWTDIERFDPSWKDRIEMMARHIGPADGPVLDVGCGPMWLRQYLPPDVAYIGLDYVARGTGCIVCDLNRERLPHTGARTVFVSGALEYLEQAEVFIGDVASTAPKCILSYCDLASFPDESERRKRGWKNGFSVGGILALFAKHGMANRFLSYTASRNAVMVFEAELRVQS
jgi:hypothetical protein